MCPPQTQLSKFKQQGFSPKGLRPPCPAAKHQRALHACTDSTTPLLPPLSQDVAVDAIVTNHPKAAMQAIERRLEQCGRHEVDGDL